VNWSHWCALSEVSVWEAALLSLGIDPSNMVHDHYLEHADFQSELAGPFFMPESFASPTDKDFYKLRVRLIHNAMNTDGTIEIRHRGCPNKSFWKISLPHFARWACSACVDLSPELHALASEAVVVEPPSQPTQIVADRTTGEQKWMVSASAIALTLRGSHPKATKTSLSVLIHKEMRQRDSKGERGMTARSGQIPTAATIYRGVLNSRSKSAIK
jgi:hypothetical protein